MKVLLRRVTQLFPRNGRYRADGRALLVNTGLTQPRHRVRTVWDDLNELDPWLLYHLEKRDD